jgi:CRP-like cAMP-binding protein
MLRSVVIGSAVGVPLAVALAIAANTTDLGRGVILSLYLAAVVVAVLVGVHLEEKRRGPRVLHVGHAHVPAGREGVHQGDEGDRFYVIGSGEAEVIGDGRFIGTMGPSDGLGEIARLRDTVRTMTVRARTPLDLYRLERRDFVFAIRGYQSSARDADALVGDRLGTFTPARGSAA